MDYSTKKITPTTLKDIQDALANLEYGSVEIYVSDGLITQITKRVITKTNCEKKIYLNKRPSININN